MIGQRLGHYKIVAKIGAGGMGEVYRAHDEQLARDVALKVLAAGTLADETARRQFRKEALALARLNHPNIETVFEFGSQDGVDFLAMELIAGQTLSEKLQEGPLPGKELVRLGTQFVEGLAAAHAQGIIHRDLKPGNLMITPEGRLKILDFGLAKLARPELSDGATLSMSLETGAVAGTVPYMAPEQLRGLPIDARSDIYAAGAVLYEMATGSRPFPQPQRAELMGAILHKPPPAPGALNPHVGSVIEGVLLKALEKEPSQRYQSARELLAALEGASSGMVSAPVAVSRPKETRARWPLVAGPALLVAVLLAVAGWLYHARRAHALNETDTLVLADFNNSTGDAVFDDTLRQGLGAQLEQSPFLKLVSDRQMQQTLELMQQPADARLTPDIARDLCQRVGSKAYLSGSIANLGSQYVIGVQAINCQTGDSLAQLQVTADGKQHVLAALGGAATTLRAKLGESLSTVQKLDTPVEQATTPSLEALRAFSLGRKTKLGSGGNAAAVPSFQRAIRLDPNFAMAYAALGVTYSALGETELAARNTSKAYERCEHVSERERFYIESHYHHFVTGDLEKARQVYELWAQTYPRDDVPANNLGIVYANLGQYEKVLTEERENLRLDPTSAGNYANLVLAYLALNRFDEARTTAQEAQAKDLDSPSLRLYLYQLAFLQNDAAGMARQVAWSSGKPGVEDVLLAYQADTAAYFGRLAQAREFSARAVASAELAGEKEAAAGYLAQAALREALAGNVAVVPQQVRAALSTSTGRDVQYGAALALALAADIAGAQKLADDLARRFPEDTMVQFNYLPTVGAAVALHRNEASKVIAALCVALPFELGDVGSGAFSAALYPVYVRGGAYLAARQGREAASEFQRVLDRRGVVFNEPIAALARLGLARAYALQGDAAKARAAYQDFFTLWKDADPDISILRSAKAEFAQIR